MNAIFKFNFQKENNYILQKKIIQTTHNFAFDNNISPKTRANNNKQWTNLGAFNVYSYTLRALHKYSS